jgi:acyl-CoA dehydrogenase
MVPLPLDTAPVRAFLDDKHLTLAERVSEYATRLLAPLPEPKDDAAARLQARELLAQLGAAGWFQPIRDQDWRACCIVREALAAASPLADAVFALQALGVVPMLLSANDAMRKRWLEPAIQGRAMASFAMTEPDAGSDVASLGTTAEPDGDGYVLSGTKTFISNAGIADFYTVFATTDRAKKDKGIGCFVVPADTAGVRMVRPLVLSAPHPLGEIAFQKARVPSECRLDSASEGGGFKLGLATLDRVRATVGAAACGMAARALAEALAHAKSRRQFGKPLADFQLIQEKLARMATDLTAARLLVYRAAWEKDRGAPRVTLEAAMAKAFAAEAAQRIVDDAVQILGGRGVLADNPVDRLYRSVRALRIYEGTTEIQQLIIAGQLLK